MERLTEEDVTRFLIKYLKSKDFSIYSYDFPQSGTGFVLRPNRTEIKHKNLSFWIPDIIAVKTGNLFLFENKDHFSTSDILKINNILTNQTHSEDIEKLLIRTNTKRYFILLGFPINHLKSDITLANFIDAEVACDITNSIVQLKTNEEIIRTSLMI